MNINELEDEIKPEFNDVSESSGHSEPTDLRGQLRSAVKEHNGDMPGSSLEATFGKISDKGVVEPKEAPKPDAVKDSNAGKPVDATNSTPATTGAAIQAPASLSKDIKAQWDTLAPAIREEFVRRENDTAKGVEQLKSRYQPIDEVLSPYKPLLQQRGLNEAQAVKQLFGWHEALSGPNKLDAFKALAQSHGVSLESLGLPNQAQVNPDPNAHLTQRLSTLEQQAQAREQAEFQRQQATVNDQISEFSKDKPHFDAVKVTMGHLLQAGQAKDLQDAYDKAVWAIPETRSAMLAEQETARLAKIEADQAEIKAKADEKRKKDAAAAQKARNAGISPRQSAPTGAVTQQLKGVSVRDSIRAAVVDRSGSI